MVILFESQNMRSLANLLADTGNALDSLGKPEKNANLILLNTPSDRSLSYKKRPKANM